ncbi:MAG: hypothetical protein AAGA20_11530 [Planctomycetota bacterium]
MFPQKWRRHWALEEDPFVQEDADKDPVLPRVPLEAVHSSFDRLYGSPDAPGPGIVFGEKGSGKSGLRLAMRRRLEAEAADKAFVVDYVDFDGFLNEARKADRLPPTNPKTPRRVVERFSLADHLDAILSLGVTQLVDEIVAGEHRGAKKLPAKNKASILVLSALYYLSDEHSGVEVDRQLSKALHFRTAPSFGSQIALFVLTLLGVAIAAVPHIHPRFFQGALDVGDPLPWYVGGGGLIALTWLFVGAKSLLDRRRASRATRAVRVVPRDPDPLARLFSRMPSGLKNDLALPDGPAVGTRLVLLRRFISILEELGYESFYVLMDRVDEATLLAGRAELMRPFVESLLEHRLLQFEGLALKLFMPIELARLYLGASPDELKSMRLDKANSIPELRWTGQELVQVAAQRLRAVRSPDASPEQPGGSLGDYFDDDVGDDELRETLGELGTPRLAFGFLGSVLAEHARELSDDLPEDSPEWRVPQRRFDILRASWLDRARGLRRALN